ncbi:putative kynureninase [Leptomonas pyrrhocoris]|uniref:Kynureninase n=1 Tax=Leptomonas pyrrhocoris TaxID=157538 RepID=A0A0M9FQU8_LEPPY|nr:putative kynureninase [Leptomonas pyrrhocoris]XP_015652577.1 putative kynureninase [Leptomonas pyrrhocoris]XP_015652578.1 putative kynureninase [Leptomonas pyrrhocoris]KPA74137.1 putative kynureninase [Leptomonas pyrrhocoris]KPA74138.1 putative kynureninase [Leptomonas pyrrhocoris]KPA74139.1 putative kynureninase [Leptomonas pyrrhocoris]|eukprot:XP_015652576.1 putative kynureninase [Leptomonas pyrrhocoris]
MRNAATETLLSTATTTGMALTEDAFAEYMDNVDPLREHRSAFHIPPMRDGTPFSYLVGNSMGPQHVGVEAAVAGFLKKWRDQGCEGNTMQPNPWYEADQANLKDMASLVGAKDAEVAIMNSLTVNLHLLLTAFYRPQGTKKKIMLEHKSFSGGKYVMNSQLEIRGMNPAEDIITVTAPGTKSHDDPATLIPTEAFLTAIDKYGDETAVLVFSAVHHVTGQWFDIPAIVKAAHAKNILVGVDCAHAVGNVPLQLHDWEVDFACWCTFKFLNSGPGNIGGIFVHNKHTSNTTTPLKYLKGWWGNDSKTRFTPHRDFEPAPGASAFQLSMAPAVNCQILGPSLKLMASVGLPAIRQKSLLLTAYLELLFTELVPPGCVEIITPADPNQRGAQLSIRLLLNKLKASALDSAAYEVGTGAEGTDDASVLQRQLLDEGVMVEKRPPDMIHMAPAPMYNSFADVLRAVRTIAELF